MAPDGSVLVTERRPDRAQHLVTLCRPDLRVGGIDVDVDGRPTRPLLERDAVHTAQVDEEIGLAHELRCPAGAGAVFRPVDGVDEDPAILEPERGEEPARGSDAVVVGLPELDSPVVGL